MDGQLKFEPAERTAIVTDEKCSMKDTESISNVESVSDPQLKGYVMTTDLDQETAEAELPLLEVTITDNGTGECCYVSNPDGHCIKNECSISSDTVASNLKDDNEKCTSNVHIGKNVRKVSLSENLSVTYSPIEVCVSDSDHSRDGDDVFTNNLNNIDHISSPTPNVSTSGSKRCISHSDNNSATCVPIRPLFKKKMRSSRVSTSSFASYVKHILCYKAVIIIAVCGVIGCFILPIGFYYANLADEVEAEMNDDLENQVELTKVCNASLPESHCTVMINQIYQVLLLLNSSATHQYCIAPAVDLFCDAYTQCSNDSSAAEYIMCRQVRQEYCTVEWSILEAQNRTKELFDCSEYEETAQLSCGEGFDLAYNGSVCLPLCGKFSQFSERFTVVYRILIIVAHMINLIGGIFVLTASFWKRKKMFLFPQILVVINTSIITYVSIVIVIVSVTLDTWNLLCPSKYLNPNDSPTFFCQLQGFSFSSAVILYISYWFLYILHLILRLYYPLKSKRIDNSDHSRVVHIVEILFVLFIGTVPYVVIAAVAKYRIVVFPPLFCGTDAIYNFYGTVVPTLMIGCASVILMLFALYKIHIHQGIFKRRQQRSIGKQVRTCQFTTPEAKVLFSLCYIILLLVTLWTTFSIRYGTIDKFQDYFKRYIECMAVGNREKLDCEGLKQKLEDLSYPALDVIYITLIAFLNFSNLPFVVQYKTVKKSVRQATRRLSTITGTTKSESAF